MATKAQPKSITVTITKDRETKNTWRYEELEDGGGIWLGTLYLPKSTLRELGTPEDTDTLTVTITAGS